MRTCVAHNWTQPWTVGYIHSDNPKKVITRNVNSANAPLIMDRKGTYRLVQVCASSPNVAHGGTDDTGVLLLGRRCALPRHYRRGFGYLRVDLSQSTRGPAFSRVGSA
jgi:hypothetical protein